MSMYFTILDIRVFAIRMVFTSVALGELATVLVFIVSVVYCRKPTVPRYMKHLPLYFFASAMAEILTIAFRSKMLWFYWGFAIFENIYFIYFFRLLMNKFRRLPVVIYAVIVTMPSAICFIVTRREGASFGIAVMVCSIVIIIPCIDYFRKSMFYPIVVTPEKDPAFWMITGIFFYFLIRMPVFWFTEYFVHTGKLLLTASIYSIQNFALVISYILFIKAMTCLKKYSC
jgi:hypothetical protein